MRRFNISPAGLLLLVLLPGISACMSSGGNGTGGPGERSYILSWADSGKEVRLTARELEQWGAREVASAYFDRAMDYKNSRFVSIPFGQILKRYPVGKADAVLLNCFDDYQGLLSLADIQNLKLELATQIRLSPESVKPLWLNTLLVIVPDNIKAPYQERYLTANIREIRFVSLEKYYGPLDQIVIKSSKVNEGLRVFKDNCVYCHSIRGVGGGKGGSLLEKFDFRKKGTPKEFMSRFMVFHRDNPDKQNIEQFVSFDQLQAVTGFLEKAEEF